MDSAEDVRKCGVPDTAAQRGVVAQRHQFGGEEQQHLNPQPRRRSRQMGSLPGLPDLEDRKRDGQAGEHLGREGDRADVLDVAVAALSILETGPPLRSAPPLQRTQQMT